MKAPATRIQTAEQARLTSLASMAILDTPPEREFDAITRLAAKACVAPSCVISLVDDHRAWFKSRFCVDEAEVPRSHAFCTVAVAQRDVLVIPDTHADQRFAGNPLARAPFDIRFYAGVPLMAGDGQCLGTLCVFDGAPRDGLSPEQMEALTDLAGLAVDLIEARRYRRVGEVATQVVDVTSDAILCTDHDGKITFWNRGAEHLFGYPAAHAVGAPLDLIMPERMRGMHTAGLLRAASGADMTLTGRMVELPAIRADGGEFPIELTLGRWRAQDARFCFAAIVRDASARKQLEQDQKQARAFLDSVIDNMPAMLFVKNAETCEYLLMNKAGEALTGLAREQMAGRRDGELFSDQGKGYEQRDKAAIAGNGVHVFESEFVRHDGSRVHLRTKRLVIDGPDRPRQYLLGMSEDVTEMRTAQAEVMRLAHHDALTGLANRASFVNRLEELAGRDVPFVLLNIDIDRFKAVNDQHGHVVGDEALVEIGRRFQRLAAGDDMVARIGGDEFTIVLAGADPARRAHIVAEDAIAMASQPIPTSRGPVYLGASIGAGLFPQDAGCTTELRQAVDLALDRAKKQGRGGICFYSKAMDAAAIDRRRLEADLHEAIEREEIALAYQPVVWTPSGRMTSVEALARWTHPLRGAVPPGLFIELAEECGLIERLGAQLIRRACADAVRWPEELAVAVNLSSLQFASGKLCQTVKAALAESGLKPQRLQLEVTESLLIRDVDATFRQLSELRALGIKVLMDDFGVGYSSLSYFQRFPFDKVKIDRSFIASAAASPAARGIIKAVVELGQTLGMGVVGEGVETVEQMRLLSELGCNHLQGYLFARPMSATQLAAMLDGGMRIDRTRVETIAA